MIGTYPPGGIQLNRKKLCQTKVNRYSITAPSQKIGVEIPPMASTVRIRSTHLPWFSPESTPNRTPNPSQIAPPPIASDRVFGIARPIVGSTGVWFW